MVKVQTGSRPLDEALGGGLPSGSVLVVESPHGAGGTEFALAVLRGAGPGGRTGGAFLTCLRSAARARVEAEALFGAEDVAHVGFARLGSQRAREESAQALRRTAAGDVLVLESAGAYARLEGASGLLSLADVAGDEARERDSLVILLHSPGTLDAGTEAALLEAADGVLSFAWLDGGPTRRRSLFLSKLRGLAPALDMEQVPVFEATILPGAGFAISRGRSVV